MFKFLKKQQAQQNNNGNEDCPMCQVPDDIIRQLKGEEKKENNENAEKKSCCK